jgi:hypothetical protein
LTFARRLDKVVRNSPTGTRVMKTALPRLCVIVALALASCNSARAPQGSAPEPPGGRSPAVEAFKLPEGAGCTGAISRYRAVLDNDLSMGHVNKKVYDQIQQEVEEASSACAAGQDGRASSLIHASKARHGYPG